MQPHSSQTQHQPSSPNACLPFHININVAIYSQAQFNKCCVETCDTGTNMAKIYRCPFRKKYSNFHGESDSCLIMHNKLIHYLFSFKKVCSIQMLKIQQWQVPVTLEEKQQYL